MILYPIVKIYKVLNYEASYRKDISLKILIMNVKSEVVIIVKIYKNLIKSAFLWVFNLLKNVKKNLTIKTIKKKIKSFSNQIRSIILNIIAKAAVIVFGICFLKLLKKH